MQRKSILLVNFSVKSLTDLIQPNKMKIKNIGDLKKYIADLPDSMEIKYYNGMVDDWHNVDVLETELIKEKPSFTLKLINAFNEREGKPLWDKLKKGSFKPRDWEFNEFIEEDSELMKCFSRKKVLLIQGVKRGKSSFDRMGEIDY
jgi:hypothetical protein